MFSGRWRLDKSKVKAEFKLQFRATEMNELSAEGLSLTMVRADTSKVHARSEKVVVREGACLWENPVYVTLKLTRDVKTGQFADMSFRFIVSSTAGFSKSKYIGEVSVDLACHVTATKPLILSLPLRNSTCDGVLHVTIQRLPVEDEEEFITKQVGFVDAKSDLSSGESSPVNNGRIQNGFLLQSFRGFVLRSTNHSKAMSDENNEKKTKTDAREFYESYHSSPEGNPNSEVARLKATIAAMVRQADLTKLEVQTLRKQIAKENKKAEDLANELACVKSERDALQAECESLKTESKDDNGSGGTQSIQEDTSSDSEATETEEMETEMEQLALDYEIMKQENHKLRQRMKERQLEEHLTGRRECCKEVEAELNEVIVRQREEFAADVEELTRQKVEHEQRAIEAEDALRRTKRRHERIQGEVRRICGEMGARFEESERGLVEAMGEVGELRGQRRELEGMLRSFEEGFARVREDYELNMVRVAEELDLKTGEVLAMVAEACHLSRQLESQKRDEERRVQDLRGLIQGLEREVRLLNGRIQGTGITSACLGSPQPA